MKSDAEPEVSFEQFRQQWLADVTAGNPSTVELGRRFAHKLVTQWRDFGEDTDDLIYCDGSGDGGVDVAFLDRGDAGDGEDAGTHGHTWYLVQSKYGKAFAGTPTLLAEGQKVIDTLDGRRPRLSSLAEGLLERLKTFRSQASERDRIVLVFATEDPLNDEQRRVLNDLRAMGRDRLGANFDVEAASIETIYRLTLENMVPARTKIRLGADLVASGDELLIGSTPLMNLYEFLKAYRADTEDLDRLYDKNVRKFLGMGKKVNKAIQETLQKTPERFGLYNNGITIVVESFSAQDGGYELVEPFIVNGCQTTRTIWEVFQRRLEAGGTGVSDELEDWCHKVKRGVVVTKVVKVGIEGEQLLEQITRHTNTQNAIREKDFLALTSDFRDWARAMDSRYDVYLEIQRGGWDSQRAKQKQQPQMKQFRQAANAFDLLKVYGSGWLGEAGIAFGKNAPFLPNGTVFKRIMNHENGDEGDPFGVDDLYATYCLQRAADGLGFGRGTGKASRKQTRFLFYMVAIDLLKDVMSRASLTITPKSITEAILKLFGPGQEEAAEALTSAAIEAIDTYMTLDTENCVFDEPAYKNALNHDLNAFLKWEKLGKTETDCPMLRTLLAVTKMVMGKRAGGLESARERIRTVILG